MVSGIFSSLVPFFSCLLGLLAFAVRSAVAGGIPNSIICRMIIGLRSLEIFTIRIKPGIQHQIAPQLASSLIFVRHLRLVV